MLKASYGGQAPIAVASAESEFHGMTTVASETAGRAQLPHGSQSELGVVDFDTRDHPLTQRHWSSEASLHALPLGVGLCTRREYKIKNYMSVNVSDVMTKADSWNRRLMMMELVNFVFVRRSNSGSGRHRAVFETLQLCKTDELTATCGTKCDPQNLVQFVTSFEVTRIVTR